MHLATLVALITVIPFSYSTINLDVACGNEKKVLEKCYDDAIQLPEFQQVESDITKAKADALKENTNWKECLAGSVYAPISITKQPNSETYRAVVCEQTAASYNAEMKLVCLRGTLNILYANFGRNNSQTCAIPHVSKNSSVATTCVDPGAFDIVHTRCANKTQCQFTQKDNYLFHDPCNETIKYLEIDFQCVGPNGTKGISATFNPQTEKAEVCKDYTASVSNKLNTKAHKAAADLVDKDLLFCANLSNAIRAYVASLSKNIDKTHTYLGCFKALLNSGNKTVMDANNHTNARDNCLAKCTLQKLPLAGLEGGKNCICANSTEAQNRANEIKEDSCSTNCLGDSNHKCGGTNAISLYSLKIT